MDFKLIRSTVLLCSLSVLVILGLVLYAGSKDTDRQTMGTEAVSDGNADEGNGTAGSVSQSGGSVQNDRNIALNGDTRAFLQDDTFWDADPVGDTYTDTSGAIRLTLIATSIQKDLRFQIVDSNGELVTGEPFFVTVEDVGQFKDLDRDGVIYVGDLNAGDYYVSIDPIEGYYVSTSQMKVHVNEKVEYRTIDDISLLILSEDQVDTSVDAVSGHNLNGDVDESERSSVYTDLDTAVMGIDVSSFNGDIDWEKVRADGIEFAIIRCGYRGYTSGSLVEDKYFLQNIIGANEAGVKVGLYFFTQAVNEVEAVEEASMVITLCREYQVDLPIFIDTESTGGSGRADGLGKAERTQVCRAFCETLENAGYRAGVYASKNWINQMLDYSQLQKYVTWLAEYKDEATYTGDYQFWQYTSHGWVDGVTGRVDLNVGNLSLANLEFSGNGSASEEAPSAGETPAAQDAAAGDTSGGNGIDETAQVTEASAGQ